MYFLKLSTINSNLRKIKIHSQQSKKTISKHRNTKLHISDLFTNLQKNVQRSPVIIPNIMDGKRIILFTSSECYF